MGNAPSHASSKPADSNGDADARHIAVSMRDARQLTSNAKVFAGALSPLSESLWKITTDTQKIGDVSARLAWKDLTVQVVKRRTGMAHTVLHNLTGYAEPGNLMAIMGPSGSGKSTLLDTLAGRLAANATQTGTVLLNGRKRVLSYGTAFFANAGFPCPALRNPSDHFLRCINSDFDRVKATIRGSFRIREHETFDPLDRVTTAHVIGVLLESYQTSEYAMQAAAKVHEFSHIEGTVLESSGSQASFWMQMYTLTRRSFINMSRDVGYYWLRLIIYTFVSICVGTIYYNVGTSYNAIMARGSCGAFVFGFITFMSIGGFPSFVEDMKVFSRERLNGHYGVFAFVTGNSLSSMPFLFLISIVSSSICYFTAGLHPGFVHFLYFALALYASVMVVEGLMMTIASVVPNFLMGIVTGAGIQGIFMLVAGYFRLAEDIPKPVWRYPLSYLSFDYWALQGQFKNDMVGLEFDNQLSASLPKITGQQVAEQFFQIDTNVNKWVDLAVIFAMVIMYRLVFLGMIKVKESVTPWVRAKIAQRSLRSKNSSEVPLALVPLTSVPSPPVKDLRRM